MNKVSDEDLRTVCVWSGDSPSVVRDRLHTIHSEALQGEHAYRCVRQLGFLKTRLHCHSRYREALLRCSASLSFLWVEVGCGVGTDARHAVLNDKVQNYVATDVTNALWDIGLRLYGDGLHPPCPFVVADLVSPETLGPAGILRKAIAQCAVVSCTAVLHVLGKVQVEAMLRNIHSMLRPGDGLLIGSCLGAVVAGSWEPEEGFSASANSASRYLHDVESLRETLMACGFRNVAVRESDAEKRWAQGQPPEEKKRYLEFSGEV